jgi:hypothetical protein
MGGLVSTDERRYSQVVGILVYIMFYTMLSVGGLLGLL